MVHPAAHAPSVLVLDDNEANRLHVHDALQDEGIEVVLAASAEQASTIVAVHPPDRILLDVRMPGIDGRFPHV